MQHSGQLYLQVYFHGKNTKLCRYAFNKIIFQALLHSLFLYVSAELAAHKILEDRFLAQPSLASDRSLNLVENI